ncbi:hypothetical protein RI129_008006 [Pyrocoelia pectoralis]|uniref:Ig-like domain-containing protein n=1 Tax=Pyrocoelia pectoralis TaxID=417401 RepID=A0AAN7VFH9_9COLE
MTAPVVADTRNVMELDCHFDMEAEELYAVKWYKDDQEFFRYMPHQQPHIVTFPVSGVYLAPFSTECGRQHCKLQLTRLSRHHSSGAYRCEISTEAPTFRLAAETHQIAVATLPLERPKVEGLQDSYFEGDTLQANCSSSPSDPAPILTWYINDHQAPAHLLGDMRIWDIDGLVSRSISIQFPIMPKYLADDADSAQLHCVSALPGVPVAPQTTTRTFVINPQTIPTVNNQKFHWPDVSPTNANACIFKPPLAFLSSIMFTWRMV